MIRSLTLGSILALAAAANAQPVLTFATNGSAPGSSYTLRYGPYVDQGTSGADQTWDLSALATDSMDVITLVDPATTTNGATFPTATVAETGGDAVMYFRTAADGMYLAGSDADGLLIPYSDEGKYLVFPCNYTDTWSDDAAAEFDVQGTLVTRTATITGEADGYGTLIMPTWSASDVLRIHWHEEADDATDLFTVQSVYDSYLYFVVGQSYPIAQLVHTELTILGNTTILEHAQWVDELSTGTMEHARATDRIEVFPMPAQETVNITLPATMHGACTFSVADVQGRTMSSLPATELSNGKGTLDVSTLTPGLYLLTATDVLGTIATARLVVE
ncbi:MAG: T9SS type A sorting domain-containing protein [Flavobacteriales bacterium]